MSRVLLQASIVVALAVIIAIVLRTFVVGTYLIPSGSMEPTLMINDRIIVDKLSYHLHGVHQGDIVVFSTPPAENCGGPPVSDLVKRVIGLPGDTVSLAYGRVYVDGKLLSEPWFPAGAEPPTTPGPSEEPYALRHPYKVPVRPRLRHGRQSHGLLRQQVLGPHSRIVDRGQGRRPILAVVAGSISSRPTMGSRTEDFALMWEWFSTHCRTTSPLYERISAAVAGDHEVLELVQAAPPAAHLPPALLAAVHYLILEGIRPPVGRGLCRTFRRRSRPALPRLPPVAPELMFWPCSTSGTFRPTNAAGAPSSVPALTWVASQLPGPYSLVDVGASAGLNLLCDSYRIDYGTHGATGPADAAVQLSCRVVGGRPPIAPQLPSFASRVGIDRSPIDLRDPDDARWLLACVWPDTNRLAHTAAAIRQARADPPLVLRGDATAVLPERVARAARRHDGRSS